MATVEVRFNALPEHVRTARLVAAGVARRAGVDDALLDEVRSAVGEACTHMIHVCRRIHTGGAVSLTLTSEQGHLTATVAALPDSHAPLPLGEDPTPGADAYEDALALTLIAALVGDAEITGGVSRGRIRMSWPTPQVPAAV